MDNREILAKLLPVLGVSAIEALEAAGHAQAAWLLNELRRNTVTATPDIPAISSLWRHKKGDVYMVYDVTNEGTDKPDEFPVTISYRNIDTGRKFSRALWRWHGSFTPLSPDEVIRTAGPGTNSGHGHVWPRPDGTRMRCGGPGLCQKCTDDQIRWGLIAS